MYHLYEARYWGTLSAYTFLTCRLPRDIQQICYRTATKYTYTYSTLHMWWNQGGGGHWGACCVPTKFLLGGQSPHKNIVVVKHVHVCCSAVAKEIKCVLAPPILCASMLTCRYTPSAVTGLRCLCTNTCTCVVYMYIHLLQGMLICIHSLLGVCTV